MHGEPSDAAVTQTLFGLDPLWRAFPLMLLSIAISNVYLYWRYLS